MAHGHFGWHDLNTRDVDGALAFHRALFGWTVDRVDQTPGGTYTILRDGTAPFGGVMFMTPAWDGMDPHWAHYVDVDDLDTTLDAARAAGGTVHFGPLPVAGVGRFGLIADPHGAVAYVIQRDDPTPAPPEEPSPGRFCWMSLSTPDVDAARTFWGAVIGYRFEQPTMDGGFAPLLAYAGDTMVADFDAEHHPPGAPAMWLGYVFVDDLDDTLARATALGATVVQPPTDVGAMGRMAMFTDPTGALTALFGPPVEG